MYHILIYSLFFFIQILACFMKKKFHTFFTVSVPVPKQPEVIIFPPSTRDILFDRAGELECRTDLDSGFKSIKWINDEGEELSSVKKVSTDSKVRLITSISFDDWSKGTNFTCEVENSAFIQQYKSVVYQRTSGRKCFYYLYILLLLICLINL